MDRIAGHIVGVIASLLLAALVIVTVVDVTGRNLFNSPLAGASELTELALVGMSFLMYLSLKEKHITIDLFARLLPATVLRLQRLLAGFIGVAVFGALSWRFWAFGVRAMEYGDATIYLRIPVGPVFIFMSILSAVTAVAFVLVMIRALRGDDRAPPGRVSEID